MEKQHGPERNYRAGYKAGQRDAKREAEGKEPLPFDGTESKDWFDGWFAAAEKSLKERK